MNLAGICLGRHGSEVSFLMVVKSRFLWYQRTSVVLVAYLVLLPAARRADLPEGLF